MSENTSVKIANEYYNRIKKVCDVTGQSISHHVNAALDNYMAPGEFFDVLWESKLDQYRGKRTTKSN